MWQTLNQSLLMVTRETQVREASPSAGVIDSQSVKTTESGGPSGYNAGKKIKGRKRHILPGGGIAPGGERWIWSRPAFLLPVRVLGALFQRLFLARLIALHDAGKLAFNGRMAHLAERRAFLRHLSPVREKRWVVYAKAPFAGPEAVLA